IAVHADALRQDVRWTWRVLRQSPGFSVTAVVVIALGVGANTAAFALLDHALLRPLPFADPSAVNLPGRGEPIRLDSTLISPEVFSALGVKPATGRLISSDDERVDGPNLLLMSHSVALSLFGSADGAVGKTVNLDNVAHTIVGVMPA